MLKNNWTIDEIREIYHSPILDLVFRAASIHRENNQIGEVQVCTLLSVKTGRCPEDCLQQGYIGDAQPRTEVRQRQ